MSFFEFPHTRNYDSDLYWLIKEVKKLDVSFDDIYEQLGQLKTADENMLQIIDDITRRLNNLSTQVYTYIDTLFAERDEVIEKALEDFKDKFAALEEQVIRDLTDMRALIQIYLISANRYTDVQVRNLETALNLEIEELRKEISEMAGITVLDPFTMERIGVQTAFNRFWDYLTSIHGLTNIQYIMLGLTNDDYTEAAISNIEYALKGEYLLNKYLDFKYKRKWVYNPVTGVKTDHYNALSWALLYYHKQAYTNDEFAALDMTNDDYINLNITNIEYLSLRPISDDISQHGLTNSDYNALAILTDGHIIREV